MHKDSALFEANSLISKNSDNQYNAKLSSSELDQVDMLNLNVTNGITRQQPLLTQVEEDCEIEDKPQPMPGHPINKSEPKMSSLINQIQTVSQKAESDDQLSNPSAAV